MLLSSINVYLRDTQHLIEVILTAWFWACPIVYAYQQQIGNKLGPKGLTWVYFLNPMVPLVLSFQRCIYAHPTTYARRQRRQARPSTSCPRKGIALVRRSRPGRARPLRSCLFLVALAIFGRLEGNFAEEL